MILPTRTDGTLWLGHIPWSEGSFRYGVDSSGQVSRVVDVESNGPNAHDQEVNLCIVLPRNVGGRVDSQPFPWHTEDMEITSYDFYRNYYELETQSTFDIKASRIHALDMGDQDRARAAEAVLRERGEGWI